jgi:hypothetical protein
MAEDPWSERQAVAAIEQALFQAPAPTGRVVVREPSLIRVSGRYATARHYILDYSIEPYRPPRLVEVRHGLWRLRRDGDQWSVVARTELAAGDARVPGFLSDGLDDDFRGSQRVVGIDTDLRRASDADAVRAVLGAYGMSADAGAADLVGALYTEDAVVEICGDQTYRGRKAMVDMINGSAHRSLLPWAAHTMGPALVTIEADRAVSLQIARTYGPPPRSVADLSAWDRRPFRFSVNRWTLVRGGEGWLIAERVSHAVPGSGWREALAAGLLKWSAVPPAAAHAGRDSGYLDRRHALDVVTAAGFRLSAGDESIRWPFTDDARIDVDGRLVAADASAVAAALGAALPFVAVLPTTGSVHVAGPSARVDNFVVTYVDGGSGLIRPTCVHSCRWDLVRHDASWEVRGAQLRSESVA